MAEGRATLQPGDLLPPFMLRAVDGATVRRADYRGRRHLVLCFVPEVLSGASRALLAALARCQEAYRAAGAETLAVVPAETAGAEVERTLRALPYRVLYDAGGVVQAGLGARGAAGVPRPALCIADRYGEIALLAVGRAASDLSATADLGLSLDDILPTLELLQVRCSL